MSKVEDISWKNQIYKYIRKQILTNKIQQGEKIPEAEIALQLGVSRTPVREAVRRLAWEGVVTVNTNKSATVRVLEEQTIYDLASVRWQHEKMNIPLVIYNGSNKDFDDLLKIANDCIEFNEKGDTDARHKYDARFHLKTYEIGGNQILYGLQKNLEVVVQLWQISHIVDSSVLKDGLFDHLKLVECFKERDVEAALDVIKNHYSRSYGVEFD